MSSFVIMPNHIHGIIEISGKILLFARYHPRRKCPWGVTIIRRISAFFIRVYFRAKVSIPNLLGNAGILSFTLKGIKTEFTRQGAVCREWLAIYNNCNAVLCFQANSKKLHFQVDWVYKYLRD